MENKRHTINKPAYLIGIRVLLLPSFSNSLTLQQHTVQNRSITTESYNYLYPKIFNDVKRYTCSANSLQVKVDDEYVDQNCSLGEIIENLVTSVTIAPGYSRVQL